MSTAISIGVVVLGMVLIAIGDPRLGGVDTLTAGLLLVILGAIGAVLSLALAATDPGGGHDQRHDRRPINKG